MKKDFKDIINQLLYCEDEVDNEVKHVSEENAKVIFEPSQEKEIKKETVSTAFQTVNSARNYLYGESLFIDLEKPEKPNNTTNTQTIAPYQATLPISPITGVIKPKVEYQKPSSNLSQYKSSTKKTGYLDTVISPIFGYASNQYEKNNTFEDEMNKTYSYKEAKSDYERNIEELNRLFNKKDEYDEIDDVFSDGNNSFNK